jgi:hypothetical protein
MCALSNQYLSYTPIKFATLLLFRGPTALVGLRLIDEVSRSHSDTSHSGLLWTSDQPDAAPLPDNTQHSQEKDNHVPGGIRTRNPSKRAVADPHLRRRSRWDLPYYIYRN